MRFLSDDKHEELTKMAIDLKKDPKTYKEAVGMMAVLMHLECTIEAPFKRTDLGDLPADIN